MVVKGSIRALLVLLLGLPAAASALGLGDIHLLSPLDAPLDAEVELVDATPEELNSLQAQIASRETFSRYGLDYPAYLANVRARTMPTPDGRQVIQLKSSEPIHQPYLTLLVELNWARGRLVREYTMLLDPPVYTPGQPSVAAAPVAAPAAGLENREGEITREEPPPAPVRPAPTEAAALPPPQIAPPAPPPPPQEAPASEPVQAAATEPKAEPPAPAPAPAPAPTPAEDSHLVQNGESLSQIASKVADSSVTSAQTQTWMLAIYQANPQAFERNMNVLRAGSVLRMPETSEVAAISPAQAASEIHRQYVAWRAESPAPPTADAGTARRSSGELKLVTPTEGPSVGTEDSPEGVKATGGGQGDAETASRGEGSKRLLQMHDADLASLQQRLSTEPGADQATAAPAPTNQATGVAVDVSPKDSEPENLAARTLPEREPPAAAPSSTIPRLAMTVYEQLRPLWWVGAAMLVALLIVIILQIWRSRRQAGFDNAYEQLRQASVDRLQPGWEPAFAPEGMADDMPIPNDERTVQRGAARRGMPELRPTETTVGFQEDSDPLAEADFHLRFAMYERALEILRAGIERDPGRRDLRVKLLEVYFESGNHDDFLQLAEELAQTRDEGAPGEWDNILIMGRQVAPDSPLFADADQTMSGTGGVDLDLAGEAVNAEDPVDFDVFGEPQPSEQLEETELGLEEPLAPVQTPADPTLAHPALAEEDIEAELEYSSETGTHLALTEARQEPEELALDDFQLEVEAEEEPDLVVEAPLGQDPTIVAGFDENSRRIMEASAARRGFAPEVELEAEVDEESHELSDMLAPTEQSQDVEEEWAPLEEPLPRYGQPAQPMQLIAPEDAETARVPVLSEQEEDLPAQEDDDPYSPSALGIPYTTTRELPPEEMPEPEPVTMSEVGTKLDLARAYVDMGDPEGARNILEEVLHEGSPGQREEAQRLMESLPGA